MTVKSESTERAVELLREIERHIAVNDCDLSCMFLLDRIRAALSALSDESRDEWVASGIIIYTHDLKEAIGSCCSPARTQQVVSEHNRLPRLERAARKIAAHLRVAFIHPTGSPRVEYMSSDGRVTAAISERVCDDAAKVFKELEHDIRQLSAALSDEASHAD